MRIDAGSAFTLCLAEMRGSKRSNPTSPLPISVRRYPVLAACARLHPCGCVPRDPWLAESPAARSIGMLSRNREAGQGPRRRSCLWFQEFAVAASTLTRRGARRPSCHTARKINPKVHQASAVPAGRFHEAFACTLLARRQKPLFVRSIKAGSARLQGTSPRISSRRPEIVPTRSARSGENTARRSGGEGRPAP